MASGKETDMSERMLNRDLRKQIGCMNGIFQLLDPNHFLAGRRVNGRNHKRLIQGAQHHMNPKNAPKAVMEEDLERQKEKSRSSMESSRPSYSSSSSCSSMFSSLEGNRAVKQESLSLRKTGMPETRSQITAMKEQKSHELQDVVKDSLYKQTHGLSVKCPAKDEIRGRVLKHVDSPRPLELPKYVKPKATSAEGSTRVLAKLQDRTNSSKDERLALPRLSYDGRESREISKLMKLKELPRLSLDSRASTTKCSALETRLDFLGCDLDVKNEKWSEESQANQESGSHNRSSSLVAKLMGLESFPDNVASSDGGITNINRCPKEDFVSRSSQTTQNSNQNHVFYSPRITRNDPASPRLPASNSDWKPSTRSRFPLEPAPWRNQDSSQDSPKVASHSRTASTNIQHRSSSVYGEIEKKITELEFKKSGKDLRALKRILEAMQKTRDISENQRGECVRFTSHARTYSLDESCCDRNYCSSIRDDKKNHQQAFTINVHSLPKITDSSIVIMKPARVMDREKLSRSTQVSRIAIHHFQNQDSKGYRDNSVHKQAAEDPKARKIDFSVSSPRDPSIEKKIIGRTSKVEQTLKASPRMKVKSSNTFGRSSESVSSRLTENRGRIERQSHPTTPSPDSGRVKRHSIKKVVEKGSNARELNIKSTNLRLSDDQFSEQSTETRCSSNQGDTASIKSEDNISLSSQMATEVTGIVRSINTNTKTHESSQNSVATLIERMPAVKVAATMMEQPSPVSVLDTSIYEEDSPSPMKKISTDFQEDESSYPDEALWNLEKLNHFPLDHCYEHNQKKLESIKHLIHELRLLKTKPDEAKAKQTASVDVSPNQDHKYINKMILTSGLLEDMNFISSTDQLHSSSHLINPNMFHILEQTEEATDGASGEFNRKSDWLQSSCRSHRKVVFDMVNEIYARKIAADGSFAPGRKRVSSQVLIKEIYLEVDRLQQKAEGNLDEDGLIRILNADMMYQMEDWADYGVEFPALVLDIERLIFKDLINEVVTSDTMGLHNWPKKHCRQLFRK